MIVCQSKVGVIVISKEVLNPLKLNEKIPEKISRISKKWINSKIIKL